MRNGWIALAFVAGALLGAVGGAALLNATRGQATLLNYELAPEGQQEIRVLVGVGRLDSFNFVDVQEDASAVRISVDVLHWRGTAPADMKLLYVPVPLEQPLGSRSVLNSSGQPIPLRRPAAAPAQTASPTALPTVAPTPPRLSRASWAGESATAPDVIARFRAAGLNVEAQTPSSYPPIFGADRVDQFLVQGEMVAIYAFPTTAASALVFDAVASGRTTVLYLRTAYHVQVANLLVVITTNDPKVAAAVIDAITRST
jgi:hypothetical protein